MHRFILAGFAAATLAIGAHGDEPTVQRQGPLAGLPSKPGTHIAKIETLGENQWLVLGTPKADPKWGLARGRSWGSTMAYAPDLGGGFLSGEGVHGWWNTKTGRYMDDLWFYDLAGHRWICVHPGTDCRGYTKNISLNADGFEATADGRPVPVANMVHAYAMLTYDTHTRRFMSMPCSGGYWKAIQGRREYLAANKDKHNRRNASPWFYDTVAGHWDRKKTAKPGPGSSYGDGLLYLAPHKKAFFYRRGIEPHFYDVAKNEWTAVKATGPRPPFGIDFNACYDPTRDRVYLGGGSYPVAKGENALWIFDVKNSTWIDPKPTGTPCGGSNSYNTNTSAMHYDTAADAVVLVRQGSAEQRGVFVYDPEKNTWTTVTQELPKPFTRAQVNAFYDAARNVHVFNCSGDSRAVSTIVVYRYKRAKPSDSQKP